MAVLVSHVIVPASGWEGGEVERDPNNDVWWSTVYKNASGVLRYVLSFIIALIFVLRSRIAFLEQH